jgi:hypothetical protein
MVLEGNGFHSSPPFVPILTKKNPDPTLPASLKFSQIRKVIPG